MKEIFTRSPFFFGALLPASQIDDINGPFAYSYGVRSSLLYQLLVVRRKIPGRQSGFLDPVIQLHFLLGW